MLLIAHREYFTNSHIIIYLILYFIISLIFNSYFCVTIFYSFAHMSSATQEDGFIKVTRKHKKRKASGSPTLPSQYKPCSSEPPLGTLVRPKPNLNNKIPVIPSGVDGKFKNWRCLSNGRIEAVPPYLASKFLRSRNYQKVIS